VASGSDRPCCCWAAAVRIPGEQAVLLAAVVEFIHTATLLHDDIIDAATVRRGRRSVNSRWGNNLTVPARDFLYTKSMAWPLSRTTFPSSGSSPTVTLRMIEGEILEIERDGDLKIAPTDHLDIIRRKTADLFSSCLQIGAILGRVGRRRSGR